MCMSVECTHMYITLYLSVCKKDDTVHKLPGIGSERSWNGSRVMETFLQAKHFTLLSRTPSNTSLTMLVVQGGPTVGGRGRMSPQI